MKKIIFILSAVVLLTASHPWENKRIAYLGDSITDPRGVNATRYWGFLEEFLHSESFVYGISGREWKDLLAQADKLKKEHGDEVDAIMIFMGTNDYNSGTPIGEWFTCSTETVNANGKMVERQRRSPVFDNSTFRGRINIALDSLKRMYPTKQIVMLTPIHRGFAKFGERNVQPSEEYCNKSGEYIDAYVNSIKEASAIWSVPVIDTYSLSGLMPSRPEHEIYVPGGNDNLHPNTEGHRRLALCLYYQLSTLPCSFDNR